jgi:hypothetical protein
MISLMLAIPLASLSTDVGFAAGTTMTFTTGDTMSFGTNEEMSFWSGISMRFGTGIYVTFTEQVPNGVLVPCDYLLVQTPVGFIMPICSWWEVLDPLGNPTGFEFHVDFSETGRFHIDQVWPGPIPVGQGPIRAEKKVEVVEPCNYFVVHWPAHWYPAVCSWWEIMDPETRNPTGYEFHVDWNNESCEFHIDEITPGPYYPPRMPPYGIPPYEIVARKKIIELKPCDQFTIIDPIGYMPLPCSWWEVVDPNTGEQTGVEFHVDQSGGEVFHIDQVLPQSPAQIPWGPTYTVPVRKKVDIIQQCGWYRVNDLAHVPKPCTWWKITYPSQIGDVEFHVDFSNVTDGTFHVDYADVATLNPPLFELVAERKFEGISPCDWLTVINPAGWLPTPCSWWKIIWPTEWTGVTFHVDSTNGIDRFHIDSVDPLPPGPTPPPWNVTAEQFTPPEPWYLKPAYPDYAPSGVPDFDQKQDNWGPGVGIYTWCGPVSVANSLWWLDSEYESLNFPSPVPPPTISDHYPLVTSYNPGVWDDHDPQNVDPLVRNLAFLMDTDGQRTGLMHSGTNYIDLETGISQYLQQQGVNPVGDCDGDGKVEADDIDIIMAALGSMPGAPNWDMRADIIITNTVDLADLAAASANLGRSGQFYEHTEEFADFYWIEEEIERCQDVELFLEFWQWTGTTWIKLYDNPSLESGHFVTCSGVNSTNRELLISDPYWDAFEAGFVQGRSPVAHPYPHPTAIHNNAMYVSHDEYVAQLWGLPPPPGYPGQVWELTGYLQALGYNPNWHAFIRAAIPTSPLGTHDVAVTDVWHSKAGCLPMPTLGKGYPARINVTVQNQGNFTETFDVTVYATPAMPPSITVGVKTVVNLLAGETRVLTFLWNASTAPYGNYTIGATAATVPSETDTLDNSLNDGKLLVTIQGDVDGDFRVTILDVVKITGCYGSRRGQPSFNPNADLDDNNVINILDVVKCTGHYGEHYP